MEKPVSDHTEEDEEESCYRCDPFHCSKRAAGEASFEQMKMVSEKSRLNRFDDEIHSIGWPMVKKKNLLGQGAFSLVYKVQVLKNEEAMKTNSFDTQKNYALKHIKPNIVEESSDFRVAATDLAVEGEILSRLRHENIIKLHGVYGGDPRTAYLDYQHGYFLLLDILEDTLTRKLEKMRKLLKKKRRSLIPTMQERMRSIAIGVAKGLEYLHENGVILRDLKPDNIGFNENGTPVIFDLGFAREVHTVHKSEVAGSLRYMSPEMGLSQGATLASDVYSFGVLLYEICTLQKPFKEYKGRSDFIEDVLIKNHRPDLSGIPSKSISALISQCWEKDQAKRPNMKRVGNILRVETAFLDVQQKHRDKCSSQLSSAFGSIGSFRSLTKHSGRRNSVSTVSIPTRCESSDVRNSFARRSSIIQKMSSQNFDWMSTPSASQSRPVSDDNGKVFSKALRRRNSLTTSIMEGRKKKIPDSCTSLASLNSMKDLGSKESLVSYSIEGNPQSCHGPSKVSGPNFKRLSRTLSASNDSIVSHRSLSGDSYNTGYSTDMSASTFTLGELKPRKMGGSRRGSITRSRRSSIGSFFQSFSARDLFGTESEMEEYDRENSNGIIEEIPSSVGNHELNVVESERMHLAAS